MLWFEIALITVVVVVVVQGHTHNVYYIRYNSEEGRSIKKFHLLVFFKYFYERL